MPQFRPPALRLCPLRRSRLRTTSPSAVKLHDEAVSRQPASFATVPSQAQAAVQDAEKHIAGAKDGDWRLMMRLKRNEWQQEADNRLAKLAARMNELSGYKEVERLKCLVQENEDRLGRQREAVRTAKEAYTTAVTARDSAQCDVNSLLERKHSWTDEDVARFTSLVRADHASNLAVANTLDDLRTAETVADRAFSELMQSILQRYHEEQIWSDKIRSASTWANQIGLLVNLVVFIGAIAFVEPWKRRKLVEKLDQRITNLVERVDDTLSTLTSSLHAQATPTSLGAETQSTAEERPKRELAKTQVVGQTWSDMRSTDCVWPTSFSGLPPWASEYEHPSHKRDLIAIGGGSLAVGIAVTQLIRLVFGN